MKERQIEQFIDALNVVLFNSRRTITKYYKVLKIDLNK